MKYSLSFLLLLVISNGFSQPISNARRRAAQKKDTLTVLACPLNNAVLPAAPKNDAYADYNKQDGSITLSSMSDTTVKACIGATVSKIQKDEEGKWEVILFYNDYWFWYSGLTKIYVKKNQVLKTGDAIGYVDPGKEIEMLLYDFETPIDPKRYMDCRK